MRHISRLVSFLECWKQLPYSHQEFEALNEAPNVRDLILMFSTFVQNDIARTQFRQCQPTLMSSGRHDFSQTKLQFLKLTKLRGPLETPKNNIDRLLRFRDAFGN